MFWVHLEFPAAYKFEVVRFVYRLFLFQMVCITPYWLQLCLETVPLFARCSRAPFSFSAQCLAVPPVLIQGEQGLTHNAANVMGKYQPSTSHSHLIGLYETSKHREEHGRRRGFWVLSKILHHRAVWFLEGDNRRCKHRSMRYVVVNSLRASLKCIAG